MKLKPLILIGGGGHCRSTIDVIKSTGEFSIIGITDKKEKLGDTISGISIIAEDEELENLIPKHKNCVITVGHLKNPNLKVKLFNRAISLGAQFPAILSATSYVSENATVSDGTVVFHKSVINAGSEVGKNCIINTGAIVEHDSTIGDHTHISTGSIINGHAKVGNRCMIGSGTVVLQEIEIGNDIVVGANSTVTKNLIVPGVYVGSPAKKINTE